ncbi:MAG: toll/interleukin-1 receptor domain-containing protein [Paludibacteraceae bacterium]|nr:toll/interleukin-1 receptor domain-containing protein [Paludibacteraceae bacterium]
MELIKADMSIAQRKYQSRLNLFIKRLKRPLKLTAETMTNGFTTEQFSNRFRELYPQLWLQISETYEDLNVLNENRVRRHLKPVPNISNPDAFLAERSRTLLAKRREQMKKTETNENAEKLYTKLLEKAQQSKNKTEEIKKELYDLQLLTPEKFEVLQKEYFTLRKSKPLEVDERLNILQEVAKYKSKETVKFLKKIQNCERNYKLQDFAYKALLNMHAPNVWLHRQFRGKMKQTYGLTPQKMQTPQELLRNIKQAKWQKHMSKDIFISHRSTDKDVINKLKDVLNKQGFDCYVDWMYDKEQLPRELSCKETAEVLIERLKQSKALLYVLTEDSLKSLWMPWELGYFSALDRPIYVYKVVELENMPEYVGLYQQVWIENSTLGYKEGDVFIPLKREY